MYIILFSVKITKPPYLLRFTAGYKYASLLSTATKHLSVDYPSEVRDWLQLLLNQQLFCQNKRGYWYDQLAMVEAKYFKNLEKVSRRSRCTIQIGPKVLVGINIC